MNVGSLISIIVPIYNTEKYLERCIISIVNQTYKNIEIVLVNDGSTDSSLKICKKWEKIEQRIIVITKKNGGLSDARNSGLEATKGKWITFIDSDDWVDSHYCEVLYNLVQKYKADISEVEYIPVYKSKLNKKHKTNNDIVTFSKEEALENLLYQKQISTAVCAKLFSKELLTDLQFLTGKLYEDVVFTYFAISKSKKLVFQKEKLYYYFQRIDSIVKKEFHQGKMDYIEHCEMIYNDVEKRYPMLINAAISRLVWSKIYVIAQIKEPKKYWKESEKAWRNIDTYGKMVLIDKRSRIKNKILVLFVLKKNHLLSKIYSIYKRLMVNGREKNDEI